MIHELKILPKYYEEILEGRKNFELRKDDRGYVEGDVIRLKAWDGEKYLDLEPIDRTIIYILRDCPEYGLENGYCILGFETYQ